MSHRCLVLNADHAFLQITTDAFAGIRLVLRERVEVLASYDHQVHSARQSFAVPAVAVLRRHVRLPRRPGRFSTSSRINLLVRDGFACAYCGKRLSLGTITRDHVHPVSRGGSDSLLNTVAACTACNLYKADRTPAEANMQLRVQPRALNEAEKLAVLTRTHSARERQLWWKALHEHQVHLF